MESKICTSETSGNEIIELILHMHNVEILHVILYKLVSYNVHSVIYLAGDTCSLPQKANFRYLDIHDGFPHTLALLCVNT